jgi:sugar O-acyltransferase (sialic acid O-acetyltransferase NeuD family)
MQRVVIIGAGGFAREVLDILDAVNHVRSSYDFLGFIVDPQYAEPGTFVNDKPVLGGFDWLEAHREQVMAICGVGAPELRFRLVLRAKGQGVRFFSVTHPSAIMTRWVSIGEGTIITAGCILTNRIRLGNHVHVNLDCTIGHDSVIEDFVTLSPGVHVSGNVSLREGCNVGTGTNIIERKTVGAWSILGAGTTVTSDVPPNSTVVGVPGKVIKARAGGWHREAGIGGIVEP